ncbi:pyridoxamine 5'-phosphate oxidase [Acidithiobacillus sp.]|uniref:pyridoxamine 5'-phosphate oxidase n=1 Tax=Acidithiobacillus sp. TaxID=1872118 RepID=UPI00260A45D6|nr:pyridoxamine 5'-phosphate oxidase [Acidithiobacillus sp.]
MEGEIDHRSTRRDFVHSELHRKDLNPDPFHQFSDWLAAAIAAHNFDATAMALATSDAEGHPDVRIVLLKHFDESGLCWYTDQRSPMGQQLAANPQAAVVFYWPENDRQVRVDGTVEKLGDVEADAYFQQRPEGSRFAAAASEQSQPIASRAALEQRVAALRARYPAGDVPRNPAWGGYRLQPEHFEFWQGRRSRLHDRFRYSRLADTGGAWVIQRLMP